LAVYKEHLGSENIEVHLLNDLSRACGQLQLEDMPLKESLGEYELRIEYLKH